jgi:hypothetical protein
VSDRVAKLEPLAAFVFRLDPEQRQVLVHMDVESSGPLAARDLLCAALPMVGPRIVKDSDSSSWVYSGELGCGYSYLPAVAAGRSVVPLKRLRLAIRSDAVVLVVRRWAREVTSDDVQFHACLGSSSVRIGSVDVSILRPADPVRPPG